MNETDWRDRKNLDYMEKYSRRRIDITQRSHCMAPTADSMCCVNNTAFLNNTIGKRQHITTGQCVCVCAYVCLGSSVCPAAGVMRGRSGTGTSCWVSRHGMTTLALWSGQNSQKHMIQYEDTHWHTHTQIISCSPHSRSGELILKQQHGTFLTKTEKDWQPVRPTHSAGIWHHVD